MNWDLDNPFVIDIAVTADDIDGLGHANNAVYITWMERCAWRHTQYLGLDLVEYQRLNRAMAVVRHEIDYLASAYENQQLQVATWIVESDQRLKMDRQFQIVRPEDGMTLLRGKTTFVCIELSSGKPKRMPREFIEGYGKALRQPYPLEL
ncbi:MULTISPECIES: acyl-CoA thioesterase [Pseudomonas]|jgi:acyl-CoA thioester hydrolase|uniref:4-hydroxybenzoyl-CoA thioesterase n=1 Tax=Pseudomonas marincola TaxID=437900 RepID=A0A1I6XXL2_9PSED|nr:MULTISPECIES: thioesterase family protein [Pseudomonas]MBQ56920.1 acyl-CoA thioesterase [Pseudomonadaceae bacterium]NRH29463.1 acyl-CoA thioesterase [Pseudomonas sp. MS19]OEO26436.1 4-hydroxybenzoyl-CoA thioesterase [Pseudomonas sp. J237]CAE6928873.1 4-hydroxybenzoyl-CoA thioesterase [Pseudomonas marincola]SFT42544.1 acyl-CoA thioester hydrolase [Pseudomonas marincola]|tara:strand:+ start:418 stop:867 length:450 start_codon:yes stop_codon:yes gene_type:complete